MLDRDLEEAEDQFRMALRAHLQNMDKLVDLQDSRLLGLEQEFESELGKLGFREGERSSVCFVVMTCYCFATY